jgi:ferredoxin
MHKAEGIDAEAKTLQQDKLLAWMEACLSDYELVAPIDESSYGVIRSAGQIYLCEDKPARPPKELVFPQREVLVQYACSAKRTEIATPQASLRPERVLFGSRPCDAAALPIIDLVFAWDDVDTHYFARRERLTIVSITCVEPCDTCFCTSLGGSPGGIEGSDVLLTQQRDSYHVQIITERGQELVERYGQFFGQSDQSRNRSRATVEDLAREKIADLVDLTGLEEALDFDSPVWETLARQCVDCGICTFLCPTCHCFDIQDEGSPDRGERVRLWDACMFYSYTKTYAGQPRPTHARRYRQRIMHKFQYYPQNFGKVLCVGCGRCIRYCPVNIDLREVLRAVREEGTS